MRTLRCGSSENYTKNPKIYIATQKPTQQREKAQV